MSSRPQLIVLYTNDAVEVRYNNGDRLHVLPCGTGFTYSRSQTDAHPVNGMEMLQQRCRYVTSTYRGMLLSALDFRNRFAEQPYLCEELLEPDQVVHLYARIKEIAWPKVLSTDNTEIMEDGSVCITSEDEFASLILSPHRRDFTVCYLSELSQEKQREKTKVRKREDAIVKQTVDEVGPNMPDVVPRYNRPEGSDLGFQGSEKTDLFLTGNKSEYVNSGKEDLNISPITQASGADSPEALSNASGSPVTPQNTVKDKEAKFRAFSTPTEGLEDNESPVCTPFGKTAVFNDYPNNKKQHCVNFASAENMDGSFIKENFKFTKEQKSKTFKDFRQEVKERDNDKNIRNLQVEERQMFEPQVVTGLEDRTMTSQNSAQSLCSESSFEDKSKTRCKYCWLNRHFSCDECTLSWSQVVKMAQKVAEKGCVDEQQSSGHEIERCRKQTTHSECKLRQINKKNCTMSQLPHPLPLSCPGQHLHKVQSKKSYDDGKDPLQDPTTFAQGRLKVLLIDGVIYRIIRLPTIKIIEVYPGDGSVLVSQGMSAHFFLHVVPHGGKIEERTYSIKSPPVSAKGSYSVKTLMNRAHRFLAYVRQEESDLPASVGLCCWKHEESIVVEPLSTTVLEECEIQGYGKFSAFSNGQIRIVFKDRTCLDMTCDFSKRVQQCLDHSSVSQSSLSSHRILADKKAGTCRLLLPNGQYQLIDTHHPGIYQRYIDIAKEWGDWVNSSPTERKKFYRNRPEKNFKMSVERELQKIQCFNYVVDKTLFKKAETGSFNHSGAFKPYGSSEQMTRPSILRNGDQSRNKNCEPVQECFQRTVQIQSPPSAHSKPTNSSMQNSSATHTASSELTAVRRTFSTAPREGKYCIQSTTIPDRSNPATANMFRCTTIDSFNSVREALLRTSSAIKDIDDILEKK